MAEINTIKLNQIDTLQLGDFITGLVSGGFSNFVSNYYGSSGYFGLNLVYASGGNQTISGNKTFVLSPNIPYSGTTGQAISKLYVDNLISIVNSGLLPLVGSKFVYATGDQPISGNKSFVGTYLEANYLGRVGNGNSAYGIDLFNSSLVNSAATTTLNWNTKNVYGTWTFDSAPLINGGYPVLTAGDQSITGNKTFVGNVFINDAITINSPVTLGQLQDEIDQLESLVYQGSTGNHSGFGGVLSINGISGNIFTQGRGTVTAYQQGNILNISGATLQSGIISSFISANQTGLATGFDTYRLNYNQPFSGIPLVFTQLSNNLGKPIYPYTISGVDTSGFSVCFSQTITGSGYGVNYLALETTGAINTLKGEQGLIGPYIIPRGAWQSGATYAQLNFVTINGVSWVANTTHIAIPTNNPATGISGANYWNLLASGTGPKGDNGIAFAYTGPYNPAISYISGEAVTFSGASYGTTGAVSPGQYPTGAPWFTIAARGASGISFIYKGDFNSSTTYVPGDVVKANHATYSLIGLNNSNGLITGPVSSKSVWYQLQDRAVVYNGDYKASQIYYQNDLAYITTGIGVNESAQYILNQSEPTLSLHPKGYYNIFTDCDGITGYNLFQMGLSNKSVYHPYSGIGSPQAFTINTVSANENGSGFDTLTLIRGNVYYFDFELTGNPFIISSDPSGGSYNGQYVAGVSTGSKLLVNPSNYVSMALNQALGSGTMRFAPVSGTPDTLYLNSSVSGYAGWKLDIKNSNPWGVFTSGIKGSTGAMGIQGVKGDPGLAFAWKGLWSAVQLYASGDAVKYNGGSYATNTSVVGTIPGNIPWFSVAEKGDPGLNAQGLAFVWKGTWNSATIYKPNQAVYYNGSSYGTTGSPPSNYNPVAHPEYWDLIAKSGERGFKGDTATGLGFSFVGGYSPTRNYISGQAVYFQGASYITTGTSSGVAPSGGAPWSIYVQGGVIGQWMNHWESNQHYSSGDAVFYNGSSYITVTPSFNLEPGLATSWRLVAQKGDQGVRGPSGFRGLQGSGGLAFQWQGNWNSNNIYQAKDSVYYDGSSYGTLSLISGANQSIVPSINPDWFLIAKKGDPGLAFDWKGTWNSGILYEPYDSVYYNGRSYATLSFASTGFKPGNAPWFVIADKGEVSINESFYFGNTAPTVGNYVRETFTAKPYTLTGFSWALRTAGVGGENLSGTIYKTSPIGADTSLFSFVIGAGNTFYASGTGNYSIGALNRVGIHLSGGALASAAGLNVGIFGYSTSD